MKSFFVEDLTASLRAILRNPIGALAIALSVAVAVGANATLLSWTTAIVLRPVSGVDDQDRLVEVATHHPSQGYAGISHPEYEAFVNAASSVAGVIASCDGAFAVRTFSGSERMNGSFVSNNYFAVLGLEAQVGTAISAEHDRPGSPVVVISDRIWQSRFGGRPSAVGETLTINGVPLRIIGVAPASFGGTTPWRTYDLWLPFGARRQLLGGRDARHTDDRWLYAMAYLAPGETMETLQPRLTAAYLHLGERRDASERQREVLLFPVWKSPTYGGKFAVPLLVVLWSLGIAVILLASVNVAGVLLAHFMARRQDFATRRALGATRGVLVRLLLIECALLGILGGLLALPIAGFGAGALAESIPPSLASLVSVRASLDAGVVAFAIVLSVLVSLLYGAMAALPATSFDLKGALRSGGPALVGRTGARVKWAFLVVQVAICVAFLAVAWVMERSSAKAQHSSPGFEPQGLVLGTLDLASSHATDPERLTLLAKLHARAASQPATARTSFARRMPLGADGRSRVEGFQIPGAPADSEPWAYANQVGPEFFGTLRLPLVEGRDFTSADRWDTPRVAIVNASMARQYWPNASALDRTIVFGRDHLRVVGVVADARWGQVGEPATPWLFTPLLQDYRAEVTFVTRTDETAQGNAELLQGHISALDPSIALFDVRTFAQHMEAATFSQKLISRVSALLGGFALLLSAIGLNAVITRSVLERRREVAVRVALGATPVSVFFLLLRRPLALVGLGLGLGLACLPGLQVLLADFLIDVRVTEASTIFVVAASVVLATMISVVVPALRASWASPAAGMRLQR